MRHLLIAALVLAVSAALAEEKEKLSATDLSVRTALTFKAPDAAVESGSHSGRGEQAPAESPWVRLTT